MKLPFSRTKVAAAILAVLHVLQEAGVLHLSEQTLTSLSAILIAGIGAFLRSAVEEKSGEPEDSEPSGSPPPVVDRRVYRPPAIADRLKTTLPRWALACGLASSLLLAGCSTVRDIADAWSMIRNANPEGVVENIDAVVMGEPQGLGASDLHGTVFLAAFDGMSIPAVCMTELDATCLRFRSGTPIRIDKGYLRSGAVTVDGAVHETYLELAACRERR